MDANYNTFCNPHTNRYFYAYVNLDPNPDINTDPGVVSL
jgi:hypothetical protein